MMALLGVCSLSPQASGNSFAQNSGWQDEMGHMYWIPLQKEIRTPIRILAHGTLHARAGFW